MLCEKCGNEVKGGDLFCGRCGARVRNGGETPAEASSGGATESPSAAKGRAGSGARVGRNVAKTCVSASFLLFVALCLLLFCAGRASKSVVPDAVAPDSVTPGSVILDEDLVAIPGKAYRMQRTEVTQRQWEAVMGYNPSEFRGLDRPVENVSWDECQEFIRYASELDGRPYRLPTEAEWEYACRAGSEGDWGKRANGECGPLDAMGWYEKNSGGETHPVAQKEPNAWGLYDMHGNVCEWCQDESDVFLRTIRGSCYRSDTKGCAASSRSFLFPGSHRVTIGFRLAVPLE